MSGLRDLAAGLDRAAEQVAGVSAVLAGSSGSLMSSAGSGPVVLFKNFTIDATCGGSGGGHGGHGNPHGSR